MVRVKKATRKAHALVKKAKMAAKKAQKALTHAHKMKAKLTKKSRKH